MLEPGRYLQERWQSAEFITDLERSLGPNTTVWNAQIPDQKNGIHILYAYAVDGQDAGSVNPSPNYSPITGRISAYLFLVRKTSWELYVPLILRP